MNSNMIEEISAEVHEEWMRGKRRNGITSRKSEKGEELMVPYEVLSEKSKELDRGSVMAVLKAIERSGYKVVKEQ